MELKVSSASSRHLTSPAPDQLQPGPWLCHRAVLDLSPEAVRGLIPLALWHIKPIFFYFTFPSVLRRLGAGRRFSFCQPWQTRSLVAQSSIAPFGGWSAALCWSLYPRNQLSSFLQRLVPSKTFFLPPLPASSCQFLPGACLEAGTVIYLGRAQPNAQASSRAWQNWNLKIALRQSALFPC